MTWYDIGHWVGGAVGVVIFLWLAGKWNEWRIKHGQEMARERERRLRERTKA